MSGPDRPTTRPGTEAPGHGGAAARLRERLTEALGSREPRRVPEDGAAARAAVTLLLRPAAGRSGPAPATAGVEALFVQRAVLEGDPWSGHMALPGGRRAPEDDGLLDTALRELWEETGIALEPDDVLGRLDELRPLSRRLPAIAVSPFIAWMQAPDPVRANRELQDHVWVPIRRLEEPGHRTTLSLEREGRTLVFPAIEYRGYTIWGLTFEIVKDFLWILERALSPPRRPAGPPRPR